MIDFHCHVDLFSSPARIVEEIARAGVYALSVTTTPKAFPRTAHLSKDFPRIRTALGLHPQLVGERHSEIALFRELIGETAYVGEIGIDGGNDCAQHLPLQKEIFEDILQVCTANGGRVMSIHSRHASSEVIESLLKYRAAGIPILHWFSGPLAHIEKAVDIGAWFSVGLPMLKSRRALSLIKRIPCDRILTETDAPFTIKSGEHYPTTDLMEAVRILSRLWDCNEAETYKKLRSNLTVLGKQASQYS